MAKRPPSPDATAAGAAKRTHFCYGSCDSSEKLFELRGEMLVERGKFMTLDEENHNNKETIRKLQSEIQAVTADRVEACVRATDNVHVANDLQTKLANVTDELDTVRQSRDKVRLSLMLHMMPHTVGLICDSSSKRFASTVPSPRQLLPNSTKPGGYPHPRTLLSSSISVS